HEFRQNEARTAFPWSYAFFSLSSDFLDINSEHLHLSYNQQELPHIGSRLWNMRLGHSSGCGFRWNESSVIYDKRSLRECMVMKWHYETKLTPFFFYFLDFQNSLEVEYDFWLSLEMECAVFYFQAKMNWTLNVARLLNEPKPSRED
ncbi:11932_t:CDS:2, partial [Rhizophagus irregularis]